MPTIKSNTSIMNRYPAKTESGIARTTATPLGTNTRRMKIAPVARPTFRAATPVSSVVAFGLTGGAHDNRRDQHHRGDVERRKLQAEADGEYYGRLFIRLVTDARPASRLCGIHSCIYLYGYSIQ